MEGLWLISYIGLWAFVILEGIILIALTRQIGLLHERISPVGARTMNYGPEIGTLAPGFEEEDFLGRQVTLGVESGRRTLLLFISMSCDICKTLLPNIRAISQEERDNLDVVLVSPKSDSAHIKRFIQENKLNSIPIVVSDKLNEIYRINIAPYGVMVNKMGEVRAKGLINTPEHLESLLNAEENGYHSIQSFIQEHEIQSSIVK